MSNAPFEEGVARTMVMRSDAPTSRDVELTRRKLGEWLESHIPDATRVEIVSMARPSASGGSSETYFVTADIRSGGEVRRAKYVLRVKPNEFRMFLRENFDEQYRLVTWLAEETDVPVPAIPFYEPDPSLLGQPFWLMEWVEGVVPPDNPPYQTGGFLFDATPEQRHKLWLSGLEAAARIPKVDVAKMPRIVDSKPGESGMNENLRHWTEALDWALAGESDPLMRAVNEWLWANKPAREDTALSWGDCRIGNMIFRDFECVAIIDWDTITLAGPQLDLAHWLVMDDYMVNGFGFDPLPGIGDRDETIAAWEDFSGFRADQLGWHEVLAAYRLNINCIRGAQLLPPDLRAAQYFADGSTVMSRVVERTLARVTG